MTIKEKTKQIKTELASLAIAYGRKDVPKVAKILVAVALCYALSPIDLIPDFIPVLGYLDDLIILPLLIMMALNLIPKDIMKECRLEARDLWKDGKPKKWRYAIPVILLWIIAIIWIIKMIIR